MSNLILIVEDDSKTLKLLRDTLKAQRYRVIEAANGKEAIELATRQKPDLITMDVQLPVMNGLDAARAIKANPTIGYIPIIALTADAMKGQDQIALEAGCEAYISKPFSIDVLLETIKKYLPEDKGQIPIRPTKNENM
ncbi:MAG: response regulator [Dehalococcoidia bacterium]|nr:MAG: response regulator [Dehalococcoidia bacterium]